jgi:hypothetical protein
MESNKILLAELKNKQAAKQASFGSEAPVIPELTRRYKYGTFL